MSGQHPRIKHASVSRFENAGEHATLAIGAKPSCRLAASPVREIGREHWALRTKVLDA